MSFDSETTQLMDLLVRWEELRRQGKTLTAEELCPDDARLQESLRKRLARRLRLSAAVDLPDKRPPENAVNHGTLPVIDGFEIAELIGRGGMGLVFRALQTELKRTVALKIVVSGAHAGPNERARFRTEAEAVAQLHDPGIVQIFEVGEQAGCPYLALEYVSGGSLAQQLDGTPMPPRRAAQLILDLARAVQHAHERGIVHRDLKPANVLLTDSGVLKITDFGLAKLLREDRSGPTRSGDMLGTPSYMAPEQAGGNSTLIGPATDVYGLGAILYELLTGRPPFKAETAVETLLQVQSTEPVSPSRLQPKVSRDLVTICLQCLQKDPRRRYATAQALAEDLHCYLEGRPIKARPVGLPTRVMKWVRRRPAIAALGAGICTALVLGFAGVTWQWRNAERARRTAEDRLYFNRIALAHQAWQGYLVGQADRILDECLPTPGQDDRRSWEWRYLRRLCRSAVLTLSGHTATVTGVTFSQDGRLLASCSGEWLGREPGEVMVWNAQTGDLLHDLRGHQGTVNGVAFTPDGRLLASGGFDSTVRLWDLTRPQEPPEVLKDQNSARVSISPDGKLLAVGCGDHTVHIWDLPERKLLRSYRKHPEDVFAVAFHPTENLVASGGRAGDAIRLWNPNTGEDVRALPWEADVRTIAFSADGNLLAAGSYEGVVKVWDLSRGDTEPVIHHLYAGPVLCVAFSTDGRLAWCTTTGRVQIIDSRTGERLQTFRGHDGVVSRVSFSPDGRRLATAGGDTRVRVWDATTSQEFFAVRRDGGWNYDCAFSPDDKHLALAGGINRSRPSGHTSVRLWDIEKKDWGREFHWTDYLASVAFGRNQLAAGSEDGTVVIWDFNSAAVKHALKGHRGVVTGVTYSPDGSRLVSAGADGTVRWWDPDKGQETHVIAGNGKPLSSVAQSADGRFVAASGADPVILVWDAATAQEIHAMHGHLAAVSCVTFSPDGTMLASADLERIVRLWDVRTGREYTPHDEPIRLDGPPYKETRMPWDRGRPLTPRIAFTADGRRLASINGNRPVRLWDVATRLPVLSLTVQESNFQCLAFSRNGRWLAGPAGVWLHIWDAGPVGDDRPGGGSSSTDVSPLQN
jgi:WD40 repeat protein